MRNSHRSVNVFSVLKVEKLETLSNTDRLDLEKQNKKKQKPEGLKIFKWKAQLTQHFGEFLLRNILYFTFLWQDYHLVAYNHPVLAGIVGVSQHI